MNDWFGRLKDRFTHVDKDQALKWTFVVGAGLLALVGDVFDRRHKDRVYREQLPKEVEKQAKKILAERDRDA